MNKNEDMDIKPTKSMNSLNPNSNRVGVSSSTFGLFSTALGSTFSPSTGGTSSIVSTAMLKQLELLNKSLEKIDNNVENLAKSFSNLIEIETQKLSTQKLFYLQQESILRSHSNNNNKLVLEDLKQKSSSSDATSSGSSIVSLQEKQIHFPYVIDLSAGATNKSKKLEDQQETSSHRSSSSNAAKTKTRVKNSGKKKSSSSRKHDSVATTSADEDSQSQSSNGEDDVDDEDLNEVGTDDDDEEEKNDDMDYEEGNKKLTKSQKIEKYQNHFLTYFPTYSWSGYLVSQKVAEKEKSLLKKLIRNYWTLASSSSGFLDTLPDKINEMVTKLREHLQREKVLKLKFEKIADAKWIKSKAEWKFLFKFEGMKVVSKDISFWYFESELTKDKLRQIAKKYKKENNLKEKKPKDKTLGNKSKSFLNSAVDAASISGDDENEDENNTNSPNRSPSSTTPSDDEVQDTPSSPNRTPNKKRKTTESSKTKDKNNNNNNDDQQEDENKNSIVTKKQKHRHDAEEKNDDDRVLKDQKFSTTTMDKHDKQRSLEEKKKADDDEEEKDHTDTDIRSPPNSPSPSTTL